MSMSDHLVKHSVWQCLWSPNVDIMYGSVWSPYDGIVYDNVCCHLIFLILFSSFGSCPIAVFRIYRLFYHQLVPCFIGNKPCSHAKATIISI